MYLVLLCIFLSIACIQANRIGITSSNPIKLSLQRFKRRGDLSSLTSESIRTNATFFKNLFDLQPGKPFHIDERKWSSVANCGLFANLTATSELEEDGECLHITGVELESILFKPSIGADSDYNDLSELRPNGEVFSQCFDLRVL